MKRILTAVACASLALGLTACGTTSPGTEPTGPVTLRMAIWDEVQMPAMQALAKAFQDEHSSISIDIELTAFDQYWTKLETAATGKGAPDIFWTAPAYYQKYAANGIISDLTPLIERDSVSLEGIYPVLIEGFTFEDGLYAIPKDIDNIGLWYNKELFDQAGLAYPDGTWTWDTLLEAAKKLTDPEAGVWGIAAQGGDGKDRQSYYSTIPQAGGEILRADGTSGYNTPEAIEGVRFWVDMIQTHKVSPSVDQMVDTEAQNLFMTGKVAMIYEGSWRAALFAGDDYISSRADVAVLPKGSAGSQTSANGLGYSLYAESPNQEAAWEFLKFLASPEASKIQAANGTVIPAHQSEATTWVNSHPEYNLQAFIDMAADQADFLPVSIDSAVWRNEAKKVFQRAYLGETSVEEAAATIAGFMDDALAKERG